MNNLKAYYKELRKQIGEKRFKHTLGVVEMAEKLANHYGIDADRAMLAALFHDCAKYPSHDKLIKEAKKRNLILTEDMKHSHSLIHAPLGAIVACEDYNITDKEVLEAIAHHTTGKVGMGKLEQIVFIADFIEPGRQFDKIDYFREIAFQNLDLAMYTILDHTICHLIETHNYLGMDTVSCRNYFLQKYQESHQQENEA